MSDIKNSKDMEEQNQNTKYLQNKEYVENKFKDWGDIVKREFPVGEKREVKVYIVYIDNMVNRTMLEEEIIKNFIVNVRISNPKDNVDFSDPYELLVNGGVTTADIKQAKDIDEAVLEVMSGNTLVLIENTDKILVISSKGFPKRGVDKPETEIAVQGPQEAFAESIRTNTVLIRRRIRSTDLKCVQKKIGRISQTDVAVMYMENIADKRLVKKVEDMLENIDVEMIYDSGFLEQYLEENEYSPFPQIQLTERPDKVAAELVEGRIAVVVGTSPFVILLPTVLASFYQASEDYYQRWEIMTFIRIIRYIAGFMAFALPGLYIATTLYNPSMLPTELVLTMAQARQNVPLPTVVEIVILELIFEALREAGIRVPSSIGSTLGIVGGIIIGQAAVEANLVSPMAVIIISITAICSFSIPNIALTSAYRLIKYFVIFMSAAAGLFGFVSALILVLLHMVSLKSFGVCYVAPFSGVNEGRYDKLKDTVFRFPYKHRKEYHFYKKLEEDTDEQ